MELGTLIDSFRLLIGADPFLFWLFLGGIIVAGLQDLRRREVDNWLNLFLLVSGLTYIFYGAISAGDFDVLFHVGFLMVVMFGIMNLFYYGRIFAGGDAKLLFAMVAFFVGVTFWESMINIGTFIFFLMVAGSIYGWFYSFVLWWKNRDNVNKEIKKLAKGNWMLAAAGVVGIILMLFGFLNFLFFLMGILIFIFPFLFVFAKSLENVSMVREVSGMELREGDWLIEDIKIKGKTIKANWDGLSLRDVELLKGKKKVLIKEGLPFVPAFLIAFLGYVFLRSWFLGLFFR